MFHGLTREDKVERAIGKSKILGIPHAEGYITRRLLRIRDRHFGNIDRGQFYIGILLGYQVGEGPSSATDLEDIHVIQVGQEFKGGLIPLEIQGVLKKRGGGSMPLVILILDIHIKRGIRLSRRIVRVRLNYFLGFGRADLVGEFIKTVRHLPKRIVADHAL